MTEVNKKSRQVSTLAAFVINLFAYFLLFSLTAEMMHYNGYNISNSSRSFHHFLFFLRTTHLPGIVFFALRYQRFALLPTLRKFWPSFGIGFLVANIIYFIT